MSGYSVYFTNYDPNIIALRSHWSIIIVKTVKWQTRFRVFSDMLEARIDKGTSGDISGHVADSQSPLMVIPCRCSGATCQGYHMALCEALHNEGLRPAYDLFGM